MIRFPRFAVPFLAAAAMTAGAVVLPLRIPFQGKLLDPATNAPQNGTFSMQFKIWDAPSGGTTLFTETQPNVVVTNGVFAVQLGTITQLTADLFRHASAYLSVNVNGDGDMLPRQPLSMSPYAFTASQLVAAGDMRVNAGTAYSTFTAQGNLTLQYGITGGTAAFTATGASTFSVTTSSGIRMALGTLELDAASRGLDATGTGVVASTGEFRATGNTQFSLITSSGISMLNGTLRLGASSRGLAANGTGIFASSGTFNTLALSAPAAAVSITADNTLVTVGNRSYITLSSNNATNTNRTICLTAGERPGHTLVLQFTGANEIELTDGAVTGLGGCTAGNGATATALQGVWPANANQDNDTGIFIWTGTQWVEIARAAN